MESWSLHLAFGFGRGGLRRALDLLTPFQSTLSTQGKASNTNPELTVLRLHFFGCNVLKQESALLRAFG